MPTVRIYTKKPCPYCDQAKQLLRQLSIPFEETDLTGRYDELAALVQKTGLKTVPQIFFGERFIGGFDDLSALHQQQDLRNLLGLDS